MKKIIAVLLGIMMLFSCAAMAESVTTEKESMGTVDVNGAFELKCAIPEGYKLTVIFNEGSDMAAMITSEDEGKPAMILSIAYNDLVYDVERLNDLDEETVAAITDTFAEEDSVEVSKMTTAYGTELLVVKEVRDLVDFVDFYTIYKGYEIEMVLVHMPSDDASSAEAQIIPVSEEEIQLAIQFLSDLDFVAESVEAPAE